MSLTPMRPPQHKVGDSFSRLFVVPPEYADAYFVGWTAKSQIRSESGAMVAEVVCTWQDSATTRNLLLTVNNTTTWKPGLVEIDVQFTRIVDGFVMSTTTATIMVTKDVTQ